MSKTSGRRPPQVERADGAEDRADLARGGRVHRVPLAGRGPAGHPLQHQHAAVVVGRHQPRQPDRRTVPDERPVDRDLVVEAATSCSTHPGRPAARGTWRPPGRARWCRRRGCGGCPPAAPGAGWNAGHIREMWPARPARRVSAAPPGRSGRRPPAGPVRARSIRRAGRWARRGTPPFRAVSRPAAPGGTAGQAPRPWGARRCRAGRRTAGGPGLGPGRRAGRAGGARRGAVAVGGRVPVAEEYMRRWVIPSWPTAGCRRAREGRRAVPAQRVPGRCGRPECGRRARTVAGARRNGAGARPRPGEMRSVRLPLPCPAPPRHPAAPPPRGRRSPGAPRRVLEGEPSAAGPGAGPTPEVGVARSYLTPDSALAHHLAHPGEPWRIVARQLTGGYCQLSREPGGLT